MTKGSLFQLSCTQRCDLLRYKNVTARKGCGLQAAMERKHSLFRAVKFNKAGKRVVFTEAQNTLFRVLSSILCSSIGIQVGGGGRGGVGVGVGRGGKASSPCSDHVAQS